MLEIALDATVEGGVVEFDGKVDVCHSSSSVARMRVVYSGRGIMVDELTDSTLSFRHEKITMASD
jgi:hypothetical protein